MKDDRYINNPANKFVCALLGVYPNLWSFVWRRYVGAYPTWRLKSNRNICH